MCCIVGRFPLGLFAVGLESNSLARECALNKNHFAGAAILVGEMPHAARFHVEGLDVEQTVMHRFNGEKRRLIQRL
jgi:hypothetical protein